MIYSVVKVRYTFYTDDGSSVQAVVIGEAMDRSDKSTNKAMSAAFKYACFQTFCIPTEEMKDSEEESLEPAPKAGNDVESYPSRGEMMRVIREHYPNNDENTAKMLEYFKAKTVNDLTNAQVAAVYNKIVKGNK